MLKPLVLPLLLWAQRRPVLQLPLPLQVLLCSNLHLSKLQK
ncbi:hypothetical protein BN135_4124 [Cronobacter muytjensii 530]